MPKESFDLYQFIPSTWDECDEPIVLQVTFNRDTLTPDTRKALNDLFIAARALQL